MMNKVEEALTLLEKYKKLPPTSSAREIQQYRDDFIESRREVADIMIDAEREASNVELRRKVEAAKLYFKYKAEKRTDEGTRQQIVLDLEEIMSEYLDKIQRFQQLRNIVEALKDASNSAASRLKTTDN